MGLGVVQSASILGMAEFNHHVSSISDRGEPKRSGDPQECGKA